MRKEKMGGDVGPVISSGPWIDGLIAAFKESNPRLEIIDRGSYYRVLAPSCCTLTRASFVKHVESDSDWQEFINLVMPSFMGRLYIDSEKIEWQDN